MIFYTFIKPNGFIYKSFKKLAPQDKSIPDSPGDNYFYNMALSKWEEKEIKENISNPFGHIITENEYKYLINNNSTQNTILLKILNCINKKLR